MVIEMIKAIADLIYFSAVLLLLGRVRSTKSCCGLSLKSQTLLFLTFVGRYADLYDLYFFIVNNVASDTPLQVMLECAFIGISLSTCFFIAKYTKLGDHSDKDSFRFEWLPIGAAALAAFVYHQLDPVDVVWCFSIYLESVAIIPQLYMCLKSKHMEMYVCFYLVALFSYKFLYFIIFLHCLIIGHTVDMIEFLPCILQLIIYILFGFYWIITATKHMADLIEALPSENPNDMQDQNGSDVLDKVLKKVVKSVMTRVKYNVGNSDTVDKEQDGSIRILVKEKNTLKEKFQVDAKNETDPTMQDVPLFF